MKYARCEFVAAAAWTLSTISACSGQQIGIGGLDIRVSGVVSPSQPSATIEVWAWVDDLGGSNMAFGAAMFDFVASDGEFSNPRWIRSMLPAWRLGTVQGSQVLGVYAHNLPFPHIPDPTNPFPIWAVTWTTEDFTPRRVALDTANLRFGAMFGPNWFFTELPPERFSPGHAEMRVDLGLECYADCDSSTGTGVLDVFDFLCFQDRFVANSIYACGCDTFTGPGVCDIFDFLCFQNEFVRGCP
jgi:hypothetical protein